MGRLAWYGVSSNTVTAAPSDPEATSLSRMLAAADSAAARAGAARSHFAVVQCPMNLYEHGAARTPNTGADGNETVLSLAAKAGVAVLINRPLNAMPLRNGGIVRLGDVPPVPHDVGFEAQREKVAALEEEYRTDLAPAVQHAGQGMLPNEFFRWADELARIRPQLQGLEQWEQIEQQMVAPHVNQVLRALSQAFTGPIAERWEAWRDRYIPELISLLKALQAEAADRSRSRSAEIHRLLDPMLPEARRGASLSQKAIWILLSTPGVTSVLNGMRMPGYVSDSMAVLSWPPLEQPDRVFDLFASKK
jgi:hypothetical protein